MDRDIPKVLFLKINKDYEKYAIERDKKICNELQKDNIETYKYKDQVIFEEKEIVKL